MKQHNIYKTTNLINGKFYWGVHNSIDENDGYFGSGVTVTNAIKKYGKENFKRETKLLYETAKEAYEDEAFIVNEDMVKNKNSYNMCKGGRGGNGGDTLSKHPNRTEICRKMSEARSGENHPLYGKRGELSPNFGSRRSKETAQKISITCSDGRRKGKNHSRHGKFHSEESLEKMSATLSDGRRKGQNNSNSRTNRERRRQILLLEFN